MSYSSEELLDKVLGGCTLERLLGQGGMGAVYLAQQERPSRHVAVKVLLPSVLMTSQMQAHYLARFRREADIIARLEHVNIVPIYAYGEQDGLAYLVMPYLQGGSLADVLEHRVLLSLNETMRYMQEAAAGLDYAHAHDIIHRDLKPANFLLHGDGRLLLSDFGIARFMQDENSTAGAALTSAGTLLGTPYYMSPEMLRGDQVDYRADLYALGIIIYQLLSGQPPFVGDTPYAIVAGHMQKQPPSLHQMNPAIPPEVDAVLQKALAKNPDDRFQTANALVEVLAAAASSSPNAGMIDINAPTIAPFSSAQAGSLVSGTHAQGQQQSATRFVEERKLVSALFIDATEAEELDEMLDPEDVRVLMERFYEHVRHVVSDYGGFLQKTAGDAALVIFGLPQAHGDDAERACAAALALRETMGRDHVLCDRLQIQQGINTGEIVASGNPATGNYDVKGDVVHAVTRLQQAARPNEILVGERTVQAARSAFIFEEERQIVTKGRKQLLRAFPLARVRESRLIGRPPLVGRRQDQLQLELVKVRAFEEQRPQLISIIGPAGIGKSRLLEEFLSQNNVAGGTQNATAYSLPYGQSLVYSPLRGLLTGLLGSKIDKQQVIDVFVRGGHTPEHAASLAEWVITSLNMEEEDASNRENIFTAWRLLIELFANQAPLIVIFEDLHWASDSLIDLVEHIMHPRTQAPLLVIALSRSELLERRPNWGGGRQNFIMLTLEPLSDAQTRELVGKLMVELSPNMHQRVAERSGGNPFFAIELIHVLAEQSTGSKDAEELDILPDTVHAAVLSQLDRLSPVGHRIIQTAAVVGQTFSSKTIHAVLSDLQPAEIDAALDALFIANLVMLTDGENYTFRHTLIREVAYGTLSRADRIRLHAAVMSSLEPVSVENTDEYLELLGYHYREAVQLARQSAVPIELPPELTRALNSWRRRDRGQWLDLNFE